MSFTLLLAEPGDPARSARAVALKLQVLHTSPGGEDVALAFRPNRTDDLFSSAKSAARLAYRILSREGVVRSQLVVRCQLEQAPQNVVGRSAELLFALAMVLQVYEQTGTGGSRAGGVGAVAATGVLEPDGTVRPVDHLVPKLRAACGECAARPLTVFFPVANAAEEDLAVLRQQHPQVHLRAVGHLEEALEQLGVVLERVYLRNPFRGLEYFDYEHRAIFFGRETEVREVIEQLLRREARGAPGVLVEGASGSGKSSFLRAGLLPALVNPSSLPASLAESLRQRPVGDSVRRAVWRAGSAGGAVDEGRIAQSILECWRALPEFAGRLPPECASLSVLDEQRRKHWPPAQRFVWLVDQLEELFALGLDGSVIAALGLFLLRLQSQGVWTLGCIRADAVPQLKQHAAIREVFGSNEGQYYLETVTGAALEDVISRPAESAGLSFAVAPSGKRLDQVLREEVHAAGENALPLLQFTLFELYQRRSANELSFEAYEQIGGLSGSIATAADAAVRAEPIELERALPRVFRSLVSVDDEGRPAKRSAPMEEIASGSAAQRRLLEHLVRARLCVSDQREGLAVVAFAHESLLRTWPRLRDWLTEEGALLQARDLLVAEARRWEQHGRQRDWLVTAADRLASIRNVIDTEIPVPDVARAFAEQSAMRARRTIRTRQLAVLSIAALGVIAALFGLYALRARNVAAEQRDAAVLAQRRSLTETAAARLQSADVPHALAIALEVLTDQAGNHAYSSAALNVFQETRAVDKQILAITGHAGRVISVAYSPDGRRIVTTSDDSTARIWEADTGREVVRLVGHTGRVLRAAFSPDGRRVASLATDHTVRVWDAESGRETLHITGGTDGMHAAAFSFDGRRIFAATPDGSAHIWDAVSGRELVRLRGHTDRLTSAMFSPNGRRVVTASQDHTACVWDAATGRELLQLAGHTARVYSAVFSPDGQRVATASDDKTARVWDARTGKQLTLMSGHTDSLLSAAFSADGRRLVTASFDRTVRIWNADTGQLIELLSGHTNTVEGAVFSPDGRRVVSASDDGTVRLWDTDAGRGIFLTGLDRLVGAAFSPDGRRVVTSSYDKTARVWDASTAKELTTLTGHTDTVEVANFSPDGRRIATGSLDRTARVWDADSGRETAVLRGHTDRLASLAFSPDGQRLATVSNDGSARIWEIATGTELQHLKEGSELFNVMFSPDGRYIVIASMDKRAHVWDIAARREVLVLSGHSRAVADAEYSPDGRHIVTASPDTTARVWDAATGRELLRLSGHRDQVGVATYSPDGRYIATASADNTARVWDAVTGFQVMLLSGNTEPVTSVAFSPDGARIMTAGYDGTVRTWDAHVLPLETQIAWAEAAQFDPLSSTERFQLGLSAPVGVRIWPADRSECDEAAAAPYDPDRRASGVPSRRIDADIALSACARDEPHSQDEPARSVYQHGRVLVALGKLAEASEDFELALRRGYRSAAVDLGMLLSQADSGMMDERKAVSLYRQAWDEGVTVAAYELGRLYERGLTASAGQSGRASAPDARRAWSWYEQAAAAGDPNALARFGAKEYERAASTSDPTERNALWLHSFRYYASAAERARLEDWPEEAWRDWRYRRASIARLLAREKMTGQVAAEFDAVRRQYASP